jgi:hypothetical protein
MSYFLSDLNVDFYQVGKRRRLLSDLCYCIYSLKSELSQFQPGLRQTLPVFLVFRLLFYWPGIVGTMQQRFMIGCTQARKCQDSSLTQSYWKLLK